MPRIRTIKPVFWSHPVMGRLDDTTKCLAIAILNLADDEGYFLADPILVRNFCRPFDDDSTNTRRAIDELSKIGYIEVSECDELAGGIGKVTKFSEHQRVDRVTPSQIKRYFDSSRIRRGFVEPSLQEGKGREGKRKKTPTEVAVADNLLKPIMESFLSEGKFADYQKETVCAKKIIKAVRNLSPDNPEEAAGILLHTYRDLVNSPDRFWSGQPFTPSGLSPLIERVWAESNKKTREPSTEWLTRFRAEQAKAGQR